MQNKIKNYFQVQNINKKKKPSNETSSPNIVLPRQTSPNTIRFLPPRDRPIHTTISRDIVYKKEKRKGKSRARRNTILLQKPSHDRHFHPRGGSCARCPVSSTPRNEYSRFPQVRSMPALEIDYVTATRYVVETVETRNAINHLLPGRARPTFAAKNLRQEN